MKKALLIILLLLLTTSGNNTFAQAEFETGSIGIVLNNFGRVRIYSPDIATSVQIDRFSFLASMDANHVFDYRNDAETVDTAVAVDNPQMSDHQLSVNVDNAFSGNPPAMECKVDVLGWNQGGYIIVKYTFTNKEAAAFETKFGFDILPQVEAAYGLESSNYISAEGVVNIYKGSPSTNIGFKILSTELSSLRVFEWFDGFSDLDSDLYTWLHYNQIDASLDSGADGLVAILGANTQTLEPEASAEIYVAIAVGSDEASMLANIAEAENKYNGLVTSVEKTDQSIPKDFQLSQNYPNPFNPSTKINFAIPETDFISLKIYNMLGQEIAVLVSEEMTAGNYTYDFNASNLTTGIYVYTLTTSTSTITKKMTLIK